MTPNETTFLRELRQLLRKHSVKLWENYYAHYEFYGPEIELSISTVEEELKHPEE